MKTSRKLKLIGLLLAPICLPNAALAQMQDPDDAFGQRAGVEQAGIYSEAAARGFDLSNANVYRLEDTFFVRTAPLPDPVISRVSVKAGIAAARTSLPSPSGVIEYSLRRPAGNSLTLATGLRDYASGFLDIGATVSSGPIAIAAGALLQPDLHFADRTSGRYSDFGIVVRGTFSNALNVAAFASASSRQYGGNYAFVPSGEALPEVAPVSDALNPPWADYRASLAHQGAILSAAPTPDLGLHMSVHRSISNPKVLDFTLLQLVDENRAKATLYRTGERHLSGLAMEAGAERRFQRGNAKHKLSVTGRVRRSRSDSPASQVIALGTIDLADRRYPDAPVAEAPQGRTGDAINQYTVTGAYSVQFADRFELRSGLSLTRSEKDAGPQGGLRTSARSNHILPFGSVIWSPAKAISLFASYVTGLEDTGLAPQSAVNANEVLQPVRSEQWEAGGRVGLGPQITASAAVFSIAKQVPALDTQRFYALVGTARHRGVEGAIAGRIGDQTSLLLGAVAMQAKVRRPEGSITAPGVSETVGFLKIDHAVTSNFSVDGQLAYQGPRYLDLANRFRTDSQMTVGAGIRYRTKLGTVPTELRISGSNLFNRLEWVATSGGTLLRTPPRSVRAIATASF